MQNSTIIRVCGLAGVGKTSLSTLLSGVLPSKVFRIGSYRKRDITELDSWINMFLDINNYAKKNKYTIIETSGINRMEFILQPLQKQYKTIRFFLDAPLKVLDQRIDKKHFLERGGWLGNLFHYFPFKEYENKKDFNRKLWKHYKKLIKGKGIFIINANKPLIEVFFNVLGEIHRRCA